MLYGKRATLHLNERRKSLRKQHADLRGLLREVPDTALSTDISERIASIQALCRTALMDSIILPSIAGLSWPNLRASKPRTKLKPGATLSRERPESGRIGSGNPL